MSLSIQEAFEPLIDLMKDTNQRLILLEGEIRRLASQNKAQAEQIKTLQEFKGGIELAFKKDYS